MDAEGRESRSRARPFVWPPAGAAPAEPTPAPLPAPPPANDPAHSPFASWFLALERCWLAPTALPLDIRRGEAGWAPDAPGDYCPRCGETTGPHESDEFGCAACRDHRLPWARFVRIGEYRDDLARCVREVKFTRWRRLGFDLGSLLGRQLLREGFPRGRSVAVTAVPSAVPRRLIRGIDHAATIAQGVARELRAPLVDALRARSRPSQRSVAPSERKRNAAHAFRARTGIDLTGWTVVLVDDVRTTGATLRAAARALRPLGARSRDVWAAAVAVTPRPGLERPTGVDGVEAGGALWKT